MDYTVLAAELLRVRGALVRIPANRRISDMEKGELFVLNHMYTTGRDVHPKELSRIMAVSSARIASLLNHMEAKGMILRCADPCDSRQIFVRLTEEGREAALRCRDEALSKTAAMLEALGPADAENYIRILGRILNNCQ